MLLVIITHDACVSHAEQILIFEFLGNTNLTSAVVSVLLEKRTLILSEQPVILPHSYSKELYANFGTVFAMSDKNE